MASSSSSKKVTLRSSDDKIFEVDESIALQSQFIKKRMIELGESTFSFPTMTGSTLSKVIYYSNKCMEMNRAIDSPDIKKWEAEFAREVDDPNTLHSLINAADYLGIKLLYDLLCKVFDAKDLKDLLPLSFKTFEEEEAWLEENKDNIP